MIEIPLRNREGQTIAVALVDDEDRERVEHYRWHRTHWGYVTRSTPRPECRLIWLHREVMGLSPGDGLEVDHRDGNKLDNRRSNLRVATRQQNAQNVARHRYRGVSWFKPAGLWQAKVTLGGVQHHLGYFRDREKAREAAVAFRAEHMPFAVEAA